VYIYASPITHKLNPNHYYPMTIYMHLHNHPIFSVVPRIYPS